MATRALVVGIERYPRMKTALTGPLVPGAVEGARRFCEWLVADGVEDISLHLSPCDEALRPAGYAGRIGDATTGAVKRSLRELRTGGEASTDTLFFYFAGHGFSYGCGRAADAEDAITWADFESIEHTAECAYPVREIMTVLSGMGPGNHFYFFDCCRSLASKTHLRLGTCGLNLDPYLPSSSRWAFQSARPGRAARAPSVFNEAVVDALRGRGSRRRVEGRAVITCASLFEVVQARMCAAGEDPWQEGHGGSGIVKVLTEPSSGFTCTVLLDGLPANVSDVSVAAYEYGQLIDKQPVTEGRCVFSLPPGRYDLWPSAPDHSFEPRRLLVEVDADVSASFRVGAPREGAGETRDEGPLARAIRRMEGSARGALRKLASWTSLVPMPHPEQLSRGSVTFVTPAAARSTFHVEAIDGSPFDVQRVPRSGIHRAQLPPGDYVASLREADIVVHRQRFTVEPAIHRTIHLAPALPADETRSDILAMGRLSETSHWLRLSESLGPIASCDLSLWVGLLLGLARSPELSAVGEVLGGFPEAECGVSISMACAEEPRATLLRPASAEARQTLSLRSVERVRGLWHAAVSSGPGPHFLGFETCAGEEWLALPVLPGRFSSVTVVQIPGERTAIHVYSLPAPGTPTSDVGAGALLQSIQTLHAAQQAYASGRHAGAFSTPAADPVLLALKSYSAIQHGDLAGARALVAELEREFPEMPDVATLTRLTGTTGGHDPSGAPLFLEGYLVLESPARVAPSGQHRLNSSGPWTRWRVVLGEGGGLAPEIDSGGAGEESSVPPLREVM